MIESDHRSPYASCIQLGYAKEMADMKLFAYRFTVAPLAGPAISVKDVSWLASPTCVNERKLSYR